MSTKNTPGTGPKKYKVSGQVFNSSGEPILGQEVLAVDVDLRGAAIYKTASSIKELKANKGFEFLGTAKTSIDGHYEVEFTAAKYQRNEIGLADVVVFAVSAITPLTVSGPQISAKLKVSAPDAKIIARSRLATQKDYSGKEIQKLDILLPDSGKRGVSEYTRLMRVIEPFVKKSGLQLFQLSASADQVSFLATETKQDASHTSLAVQADKLRTDYPKYKFSSELFYGIGRQNIALSWVALAQETAADLMKAIQQSIAQNIISPAGAKVIKHFVATVADAAKQHSSTAPETASFFKTIGFAIQDPVLKQTFSQAYLQHKGQPEVFWENLSQKPGFAPDVIRSLQLTNQLSILTGQNMALIEELQVKRAIKDPSDLLSLSSDDWNEIVSATGVPASVSGNTPQEQAANYISGMQNMLNACYPTQKISLMVQNKQLPIADAKVREGVSGFLAAAQAQGFEISTSRVIDFDAVIKKAAGDRHDDVLKQLQWTQRLWQLSPTPEVLSKLMEKAYTSALHIASIPQDTFIRTESEDLGGVDVAISVYNRARHHVMRAQHTLLKMRDHLDPITPAKVISADAQIAINNYLQNLNP